MKQVVGDIVKFVLAVLPFFKKKDAREIKEFSELVTGQYEFLAGQLERVLKDYFEVSAKVREMHTELFGLRKQLAESIKRQCLAEECRDRV